MFYQVRIINPNGTVKKIISNAELSKIHWNKFQALAGKNKTKVLENKFNLKAEIVFEIRNDIRAASSHQ